MISKMKLIDDVKTLPEDRDSDSHNLESDFYQTHVYEEAIVRVELPDRTTTCRQKAYERIQEFLKRLQTSRIRNISR